MDLARMRPTWAEVDLDAIKHNVAELRRMAPGARFMAAVKADGYGHGAVPVAQAALEAGAAWLGVATVEEGMELRKSGLTVPVLVFGYIPPTQADCVVLYDLRPTVFHLDLARALGQWGRALMRRVPVHLKVDTGMGRIGVRPTDAVEFARSIAAIPHLDLEGIFTHLARADEPEESFTAKQLATFQQVLSALRDAGIEPEIRHACNSAGIMVYPSGHYDLVRAGISLYGLPPNPAVSWPVNLRPALTWKTRVGQVKTVDEGTPISYGSTYRTSQTERIASLPVGYADGFFRGLSNRGEVLIRGRRCPVVGRICMDQTLVCLRDEAADVSVGDEVVLIGVQGRERITASDMAELLGTINYEVLCAIGRRVPRLYRKDGELQK